MSPSTLIPNLQISIVIRLIGANVFISDLGDINSERILRAYCVETHKTMKTKDVWLALGDIIDT